MKKLMLAFGAVVALSATTAPARAQEAAQTTPAATERKEPTAEPEKETSETKSETKGAEGKAREQGKKTEWDWQFRWNDHPSLRLGPGTRVDFRARFQGDLQGSDVERPDGDDVSVSSADISRKRIGIDGEILNIFDYQVEGELGADHDPWRDVYLNYKQYGFAEVQAGKFKLPFSLDENTSPTSLDFVYRSRIAALLAPGRDKGVMVHGRFLKRGLLRYEFGVFSEDGANARTFDTDRVHGESTIAGRLIVQPFRHHKSMASDLAFGAAFTRSDLPEGVTNLRGRTEIDDSFYHPDFLVNGRRQRVGLELRWRPGPFSVKSEYIRLTDQRLGQSVDNGDLDPFTASGWYLSGTWALTGEKKADGLDTPRRPLFQGGFGAVELAARIERIRFGSVAANGLPSDAPRAEVILGNADLAYTFGVNWYANRWLKIQANLVRDSLTFPELGPSPSQPVIWSRIIRFQFSM
jgi:phosphate-selective porin OprO/OprP